MKIGHVVVLGLATLAASSCGSIAPVKIHAGDQCYRCRRSVNDERVAAEIINGTFVSKFRAPGCLAIYLADHPNETGAIFVTDYTTGKMIAPEQAYFVPLLVNRDTGERDYRAYRLKAIADLAAADAKTEPVVWGTVLDKARP